MGYKICVVITFLISIHCKLLYGQEYDSTYYEKYLDRLCVTLNESNRNYHININSKAYHIAKDSIDIAYSGNTPFTTGVSLDWDIFSLSLSFKSVNVEQKKKGLSDYFNIYFGFGNAKYIAEIYYRYLKGFYDRNLKDDDSSGSDEYFSQPNLEQQVLKGKFIYVFNSEKFAFKNGYTAIYYQKENAGSFLLQGNIFYNLQNNDNPLVPPQRSAQYEYSYKVNYFSTAGAAVGAGCAGTLVISRKFFVNGTLFTLAEYQHNLIKENDGNEDVYNSINGSFDTRVCFGYNIKSFYASLASKVETSIYRFSNIGLRNSVLSFDFNIGYRFKVKDPKFMKTVRKTGVYKVFD